MQTCRSLQCPGCAVKAEGSLPEEVARLPTLATLNLQQNRLAGPLPWQYAAQGALPRLLNLIVTDNRLTGAAAALLIGGSHLTKLCWQRPITLPAALHGRLPPAATEPPLLPCLHRPPTLLPAAGPIPEEWSSPDAFPSLSLLGLGGNALSGTLPPDLAMPSLLVA